MISKAVDLTRRKLHNLSSDGKQKAKPEVRTPDTGGASFVAGSVANSRRDH
jgi:hypothetical protein